MRERAAALGGTLAAGPRDGGGWRVRAVLPAGTPAAGAGPRLRRWLRSRLVLDAGLVLLALLLPLAGATVLIEEDGVSPSAGTLILLAVVGHAVPLLWRRQRPWTVLGVVALTAWLAPLLAVTGVTPSDGGWLFLFSWGAELVAVHTVAERGVRPQLTVLGPAGAGLSAGLAISVLASVGPPAEAHPVLTVLAVLFLAALASVVLAVPFAGAWLTGHAARRRRQGRLDREESAVAAAAAQAELRARDERARIAAGLREAVLDHAARVPRAADADDLDGVLDAARQALAAMRGLLDGLGSRAAVAAGTGQEASSSRSG